MDFETNKVNQNQLFDYSDIDISRIFNFIKNNILVFTLCISLSVVFGIIIYFLSPNKYSANCTLIPQSGEKSIGNNLGGLAAMAGININNYSANYGIPPTIYPKLISNVNFQKELLYSDFYVCGSNQSLTLIEIFNRNKATNKNTFSKILSFLLNRDKIKSTDLDTIQYRNIVTFDQNEERSIEKLQNSLSLNVNNKDGFITITSIMEDPLLAAEVVEKTQNLLQKYLTTYKIEKVQQNLNFIEKNLLIAKIKFEDKLDELAKFRDSNKNFISSVSKTQEEKLVSEYNLSLSIYSELSKQFEQAKISVTENTPVLTIIEPVYIPTKKISPSLSKITIISFAFGFIISIVLILLNFHLKIISYLNHK